MVARIKAWIQRGKASRAKRKEVRMAFRTYMQNQDRLENGGSIFG